MNDCTCDQHGDYCPVHPNCACGCPKHAHVDASDELTTKPLGACAYGKMNCYGCVGYRPAKLKHFHELSDDDLERATVDELRLAYRDLRAHHIEETTALWTKLAEARQSR